MVLRYLVGLTLLVTLFRTWHDLDQVVPPALFRPAHFLYFVAIGVVAGIMHGDFPWRDDWTRLDQVSVATTGLLLLLLWISELTFDYRLSHWWAFGVYALPFAGGLVYLLINRLATRK